MRCAAPISDPNVLFYRASNCDSSPRCRRQATTLLTGAFGPRGFCHQHVPLWREHNRIVERVLAIGKERHRVGTD